MVFHTWGSIMWQWNCNTITDMSKYPKHTHTRTHAHTHTHTHTHTIKLHAIMKRKVFSVQCGSVFISRQGVSSHWGHAVDIRGRLPWFRVGTRKCRLMSPEHTTKTTLNGQQVRTFLQIHQSLLWISSISATTLANIITSNQDKNTG